jgi:hypothetical protein
VVVNERPWQPDPQRIPPNKRLSLKVEYGEVGVGKAIRAAGSIWDKRQKVWELTYNQIMALRLMDRVVSDGNDEEAG